MAKKRPEKRAYHHGDLRHALLQVAARLVDRRKDVSFTLRELAVEAAVSHAAAYRHFASKQALLAALAEQGFLRLQAEFDQAQAESPPDDPPAQLCALGVSYVRFATQHPGHYRTMFLSDLGNHERYPGLATASRQAFATLVACVTRGVAAGALVPAAPLELAALSWSMVHGLALLALDGQLKGPLQALGQSPVELAKTLVQRQLQGVMQRQPHIPSPKRAASKK